MSSARPQKPAPTSRKRYDVFVEAYKEQRLDELDPDPNEKTDEAQAAGQGKGLVRSLRSGKRPAGM